ncbi:putative sugar epimerase YhfK [Patiriisocius marinistellae]|uniref:Putative sugar epimerase YhfK n=1 Tax=Patiriisocius marinistellae TaxID=2494560 RepID=A0A5J4G0K1_9FLAO|nr:SDR family oxidoreductase [Patiriisocius marinistellae]GEQ87248.1 putative sugar epimerase YhfK [Patiriisocius marinistellae]
MEKILVAGATGTTGKKIIDLLNKSGKFTPVAMVRNESQQSQFKKENIETVMGDLSEDVSHTTKGIDRVIFAAGSGGKNVYDIDQEGAKRLIDASKKERIKKFVMLSSMGADNPQGELKEYLQAKQNADQYLDISGLTFTIVRPGTLNNEEGIGKIKLSHKLNERGEIPRWDVARTLVKSLDNEVAKNQSFEILRGETSVEEAVENFKVLS